MLDPAVCEGFANPMNYVPSLYNGMDEMDSSHLI